MKNLYMLQPQYAVEIRKEDTYWLPYSVGCLWAYCSQFEDIVKNYTLKDLIFRREDPEELIDRLDNPAICAFSCYVWNEQYNLHVAKLIKERFPECIIEFGGPQATHRLNEYDFIDCIIVSEGEEAFLDFLRKVNNKEKIDKIYAKKRIEDLNFPSPYQIGVFDKIIEDNPGVLWAMTMETNRGCPHRCTYCDWGGLTYTKVRHFDIQRVKDDIDWARKNNVGFIFNADANFGMFKERDLEIAKLFREAADEGNLEAINIQYSKNSTEVIFEIAKILGDISRGVTLSVQTMNEPTLKAIKRKNMSINKISEQIEKSKEYGVKTYTELILGLPEETLDTWKDGFSKILECGQHESIDVWFCQMFGDTELNSTTSREVYGIKTIKAEDYVSFGNDRDYDGVTETIELISETNTMTNNQLIEAYMYGWLIVQFHIAGYTQIVAKHYYENLNISYRVFYDTLFEFIKLDNGLIGEHYREIESAVNHYMKTGKILKKGKHGHTLHAGSFAFMFTHKDEIFKLVENATQKITPIKTDIISLQRAFIFDEETQYPFYLTCEDKKYKIDTEFKSFDKNDPHTVFILRRKGLLKNQLCKV
jgi:putative methyltransferase